MKDIDTIISEIKLILYRHTEFLECGYSVIKDDENQSGDDNYTTISKEICQLFKVSKE